MSNREIRILLVANRGEIARRVIRTARDLGITTVAVYSAPDRLAPHVADADTSVPLGGESAAESYLDIAKLIDAARRSGADAVHPGYGFLAENADFATACTDEGLTWIGPRPETIRVMADKVEAKALATRAGVPTLPSAVIGGDDPRSWTTAASAVGYPLLVKSSAGGGGKGMRRVDDETSLADAIIAGRREAQSSFGDPTVFVERLLERPRHVEVQIFGDENGTIRHLLQRDCSIQRRHQKVVEEAPGPELPAPIAAGLLDGAVALGEAIGYLNAGTVEFLVAGDEFFFLEMNTRLQVEHPVTEAVVGMDLVALQLAVASGGSLAFEQDEVRAHGHAIEVRLYAEDPAQNHLPSVGIVQEFSRPSSPVVRWDSGVEDQSVVHPFYDPMIAKVVSHGSERREAAARLASALRGLRLHGIRSNRDLLVAVLEEPSFRAGDVHTAYLDDHPEVLDPRPPEIIRRAHLAAAAVVWTDAQRAASPAAELAPPNWRALGGAGTAQDFAIGGDIFALQVFAPGHGPWRVRGADLDAIVVRATRNSVSLEVDGLRHDAEVSLVDDTCWVNGSGWQSEVAVPRRLGDGGVPGGGLGPTTSVPGTVVAVEVVAGQRVVEGQVLIVVEAMKMEHRVVAEADGTVDEVLVAIGDQVGAHEVLVRLSVADAESE